MTEHAEEERDDGHLAGVDAGAGCAEIWEHLSEQREEGTTGPDSEDAAGDDSVASSNLDDNGDDGGEE